MADCNATAQARGLFPWVQIMGFIHSRPILRASPQRTFRIAVLLVWGIVLIPFESRAFAAEPETAAEAETMKIPSVGAGSIMRPSLAASPGAPSEFLASIERIAREQWTHADPMAATRIALTAQANENRRRRSVKSGAWIGAAIGAGVGAVAGAMAGFESGERGAAPYGAALFGGIGAAVGAGTGAIIVALRD